MLSSGCSEIGTGSSNSPRSANESLSLRTFPSRRRNSARLGVICRFSGTGEDNLLVVRAQDAAKSLLASEAVPSTPDARQDRIADVLGQDGAEVIELKRNYAIPAACSCAVQRRGRSIRSAKASAVSSGGWLPATIASTICGARNARRVSPLVRRHGSKACDHCAAS